ncbi:MAG: hypothetical protein WCI94_14675 [Rhodospirillales bacterium]
MLNPSDFPTIEPMGDVAYDLSTRLGMNVASIASDRGSVQQRRNSKETVEKGGWSVTFTRVGAHLLTTPVEAQAACDAMQIRAFDVVPSVPTGQFQIRTAWRKSLTGAIESTGVFFWNVQRV